MGNVISEATPGRTNFGEHVVQRGQLVTSNSELYQFNSREREITYVTVIDGVFKERVPPPAPKRGRRVALPSRSLLRCKRDPTLVSVTYARSATR